MRRSLTTLAATLPFALALAACASDSTGTDIPSVPHGDIVIRAGAATLGTHAFNPDTLTISLATSGRVVWSNGDVGGGVYGADGVTHSITADGGEFTLGNQAPGRTKSFTFDTAGTYPYHCSIHPSMMGVVVVTP